MPVEMAQDEALSDVIHAYKRATGEKLRIALKNYALHWDKLKTTELEDYKIFMEENEGEEGQESNGVENQKEERFVPCFARAPYMQKLCHLLF
ncbi:unnamed protein product [Euphydryas editha]|uniref:Uncharacterized protein n=1 Tax=Euphydryas editha TaxID=104508 RepID=A0AAU9V314_EUPED|nr:unnamed protein product [Euphydryas editha]